MELILPSVTEFNVTSGPLVSILPSAVTAISIFLLHAHITVTNISVIITYKIILHSGFAGFSIISIIDGIKSYLRFFPPDDALFLI